MENKTLTNSSLTPGRNTAMVNRRELPQWLLDILSKNGMSPSSCYDELLQRFLEEGESAAAISVAEWAESMGSIRVHYECAA